MKLKEKMIAPIAKRKRHPSQTLVFEQVFTDSREQVRNGLFIPIVGERFDGHSFLIDAIKNGATAALWQESKRLPNDLPNDFQLYFVEDTIKALQQLAHTYLKSVEPTVIGITGSNGKTTTKDILASVLSTRFKSFKTQGNLNNHLGLPLTILAMPADCEVLILEMGMNHFHEIELLSKIAEPDYAIITNIGESHIEHLGSREGIAKAKMEIVAGLKDGGKVIIDGDEPLLFPYRTKTTVSCGYNQENNYQINSIKGEESGFQFRLNDQLVVYDLPLLGRHNVKNATYAIVIANYLGIEEEKIKNGLKNVQLTKMRLEKKRGKNNALIINDAYNASPSSMVAAIDSLKDIGSFKKQILILGDMYELGKEEEALHRKIAGAITHPTTHLFAVGKKGAWIGDELIKDKHNTIKVEIISTKEEVSEKVIPLLDEQTVVLVKASRGMQLETVVEQLLQ